MLPILSWRSIIAIFLGLVVGLACGLGYSSLGDAKFQADWPPVKFISNDDGPVYETTIQGRIMPASADETFIRTMDGQEQYYAARMGSLPFFQYLSGTIAKQNPQYSHTPEDLSQKITVSYVTLADNPAAIQIKASFATSQESLFMVQKVPQVFQEYILNEQNSQQAAIYQSKLKEIETTRASLAQSRQDLQKAGISTVTKEQISSITSTEEYIKLSARIKSLQNELANQAQKAAELLAQGIVPVTPPAVTQPVSSTDLAVDETSLAALEAKIKGLEEALLQKAWVAAGFTLAAGSSSSDLPAASVLDQSYRNTISQIYTSTINGMELTSTELSKAQADMDIMQSRINQERFDQAVDSESRQIAFTLASDQVSSISRQLESQTQELKGLGSTIPESRIARFYAVQSPLDPSPVSSNKSAPLIGAVLGMFIGWVIVNRRWLAGGATAMAAASPDVNQGSELRGTHTAPEAMSENEVKSEWKAETDSNNFRINTKKDKDIK